MIGRNVALLAALLAGCSSGPTAKDAGLPDAGSDAGLDASVDAGPKCPSGEPIDGVYAAPHRVIPPISPALAASGVRTSVRLVTVTASNETLAPRLHAFVDALAQSDWYSTVGAPYGLQRPTKSLHFQDVAPPPAGSLPHTDNVAAYLAKVVEASSLPTGDDVLYVLFLPPGTDVGGAAGFHGLMSAAGGGLPGAFAVASRLSFTPVGEDELDTLTVTASHEILEAMTNWDQNGLVWGPAPANAPWTASIFDVFQVPDEIGDVCSGTRVREPLDGGFLYQRIFSNDVAVCGGGNSCVPVETEPHYAVSAEHDWYAVTPGQSLDIPFSGWSTAPTDDWLTSTQVIGGSPQCGGAACPTLSLSTPLGAGSTGCTGPDGGQSPSRWAMNNGVQGTLTVQVPGSMTSGQYTLIGLFSHRAGAGNDGCSAPAGSDYYHLWPVGIYVP